MIDCVTSAIADLATDVVVRRKASGAHDEHGRWQEQDDEEFTIKAVVQPARGHELVRIEEGRRTRGAIKVYTTAELRTASVEEQTQPDRIVWAGVEYEVEYVDDWDEAGGYYKAVALKVGQ